MGDSETIPKGTISFFLKAALDGGGTFPWLPESQACVPFQTLPSSYLRTTFLKPEQSLPSPQREKCYRLIHLSELWTVCCLLEATFLDTETTAALTMVENQMASDRTDTQQTGPLPHAHLRSHRAPDDHLWKGPSLKGAPEKILACCFPGVVCVSALPWHSEAPPQSNRGLAESTLATGHRGRRNHATNGQSMALVMFYWDTEAQLITGQQGLGCPQKSRHRNPRPARGQQQKMSWYN